MLVKLVDDTKLNGRATALEDRNSAPKDLGKLEMWAENSSEN